MKYRWIPNKHKMRHVQDSQDTGFWKRDFVVRVDVPQNKNNQEVKIIKEDFIEQAILQL